MRTPGAVPQQRDQDLERERQQAACDDAAVEQQRLRHRGPGDVGPEQVGPLDLDRAAGPLRREEPRLLIATLAEGDVEPIVVELAAAPLVAQGQLEEARERLRQRHGAFPETRAVDAQPRRGAGRGVEVHGVDRLAPFGPRLVVGRDEHAAEGGEGPRAPREGEEQAELLWQQAAATVENQTPADQRHGDGAPREQARERQQEPLALAHQREPARREEDEGQEGERAARLQHAAAHQEAIRGGRIQAEGDLGTRAGSQPDADCHRRSPRR